MLEVTFTLPGDCALEAVGISTDDYGVLLRELSIHDGAELDGDTVTWEEHGVEFSVVWVAGEN